ncbi:MAG: flagellar FlbD family protein [Desulfobulbaceae bacterium]|nr:flagellar FlbD family protein [Desulfobulbaceae bacterium]
MIKLTRRDNQEIFINSDLIETIEETPDTVITLTTGHRHLVCESAAEILDRIMAFKSAILRRGTPPASAA